MKQLNNDSNIKIVFFGTPAFVDPVVKALEESFDVVAKIRKPQKFDIKTIEQLKSLHPDLFIVAAYGQILPKEILSIPKLASINIHPSLLPKYRGPSPIQTAILNGDKKAGVAFIKMDEKVDHGLIIDQFEEEIFGSDTFESLSQRLFNLATKTLVDFIFHHNAWKLKPQEERWATYTKQLTKRDGFIDLSSLEKLEIGNWKLEIARRIRAYYPWPGTWTKFALNGKESIIKLLPEKKIQVEGKRPMSYKDFKNGYEKGKQVLNILGLD